MTQNSNPRKQNDSTCKPQKYRSYKLISQLLYRIHTTVIDMKSHYDFTFFSTMCSSFQGFKYLIKKLENPQKQQEIYQTQKNGGSFVKPKKNSSKVCLHRKIDFGQMSNPKNRTFALNTSIIVAIYLTLAALVKGGFNDKNLTPWTHDVY